MNESEWLACTDPRQMVEFLRGSRKASDRQCRLFAAACYRRVWHLLADRRSRLAVEVLERLADGGVPRAEVEHALLGACNAHYEAEADAEDGLSEARELATGGVYRAFENSPAAAVGYAHHYARLAAAAAAGSVAQAAAERAEAGGQCRLLRDIFGPFPLGPSAIAPSVRTWNGGLVRTLAQAAYEERDLRSGHLRSDRLAVLADGLQDAGFEDAELLGHLRGGEVHVRGCWAVDFLLREP
jgi:hypothetical protein